MSVRGEQTCRNSERRTAELGLHGSVTMGLVICNGSPKNGVLELVDDFFPEACSINAN